MNRWQLLKINFGRDYKFFYVPERSFMYVTFFCWFLISFVIWIYRTGWGESRAVRKIYSTVVSHWQCGNKNLLHCPPPCNTYMQPEQNSCTDKKIKTYVIQNTDSHISEVQLAATVWTQLWVLYDVICVSLRSGSRSNIMYLCPHPPSIHPYLLYNGVWDCFGPWNACT